MEVISISVSASKYGFSGISLSGEIGSMSLTLSDTDKARLLAVAREIFLERQPQLAKGVAEATMPLLTVEGAYTEVPDDV